ncbi:MFS general substrate transporter [Hyaloscypha bicolor E]|uniref:MFS general substrate transporter n=1 Tax=Hyaloscypha bicolor E TaxID=1095630 RepID=A0A2J6TMD3_9HELO|nr:MFS general substrate transporter [Hyaloscypha bicolor E]PMD64171.1 MFS general substrate transporter [Hyaloscypha bicolor E]
MASSTPPSLTKKVSEIGPEESKDDLSAPPSDNSQAGFYEDPKSAPEAPQPTQDQEWVSGFKLLTIMTAVSLVCLLMLLDTSIIAIPKITNDFHSLPDVGWYGSGYQVASAVLQPLTGKFYSNFNSNWTFLAFFAIFELASLLCGVANSSKMLIVGRVVAGMGSSGITNGAFTIIAGCVPMAKRPALIGFVTAFSQLGLITGPLIGGLLTEYTTWRWCFYINLPIGGFVAVLLIFIHVPDQLPKPPPLAVLKTLPEKLDLTGFALFAPAVIQLLLALQWGGITYTWNSAKIIGLFCGAGGTFAVFLAWDYRKGDDAMIPFSTMGKRTVWSSCVTYGLFMGQLFTVSYYLPIYFQGVKGASPTMSGVYVLPIIGFHILAGLISGVLIGKLGYYLPFSVLGSLLVAIANGLLSTSSPGTSTGRWVGYQIIGGVGRGLGMQPPIIAIQNTLQPAQIPVAMALLMFSQAFGGALFLSFSDTILTNSLKTLLPKYSPSVDPQAVINAGATGFRTILQGADLVNVVVVYAKSVDRVFYLTAGAAVGSFMSCWFMGFKDIRKKQTVSKA